MSAGSTIHGPLAAVLAVDQGRGTGKSWPAHSPRARRSLDGQALGILRHGRGRVVGVAQFLGQLLRKMGKVVELGKAHLSLLAGHVEVQSGLLRWHRQLFFAKRRVVVGVRVAVIVGLVDASIVLRVDQGRELTRGMPVGQ